MSDVTPIRPDVPMPSPVASVQTVSVESMDEALNDLRDNLYQAMGIVSLATRAAQSLESQDAQKVDIWTALNGAYALLERVAARLEDSGTMLEGVGA